MVVEADDWQTATSNTQQTDGQQQTATLENKQAENKQTMMVRCDGWQTTINRQLKINNQRMMAIRQQTAGNRQQKTATTKNCQEE